MQQAIVHPCIRETQQGKNCVVISDVGMLSVARLDQNLLIGSQHHVSVMAEDHIE